MSIESLLKLAGKYEDIVLLNRAMIIAGIAGLFSGAYVAQLYSEYDNNKLANALIVLLIEYAVYIPFFAVLFYVDNRHKYHDPISGKRKMSLFKQDIMKLAIAMSVSEVVYSVTKISLHYQFLQFTTESYQASLASSLIGWIVFFFSINVIAKRIRLFRYDKN